MHWSSINNAAVASNKFSNGEIAMDMRLSQSPPIVLPKDHVRLSFTPENKVEQIAYNHDLTDIQF